MTSSPAVKTGRPKSEAVDDAIQSAVLQALATVGYEGLAIAQIAREAGTAITSVYRRYPDKESLVTAVLRREFASLPGGAPDGGSLRADLLAHVMTIAEQLTPPRARILAGLLLPMLSVPTLAQVVSEELTARQVVAWRQIIDRAVARGELAPGDAASTALGDVPRSVIFTRSIALQSPLTDTFARELVDTVLLPALRGAAASSGSTELRTSHNQHTGGTP